MTRQAGVLADEMAGFLLKSIAALPFGFYDSFDYTCKGNNLTHPLTLGIIVQFVCRLSSVSAVGVDVRFNVNSRIKFQPDVVGFTKDLQPRVLVDYESPNSSDARVPEKDMDSYNKWRDRQRTDVPYLVITTLPDDETPRWELRYTGKGNYNHSFAGSTIDVRRNPFRFWYAYYDSEFSKRHMDSIAVLNISGRNVARIYPE